MNHHELQNLLPYQLEPEFTEEELQRIEEDRVPVVRVDDGANNIENPQDRLGNNLWCTCDNCVAMPTVKECLCCNEEPAELLDKLHEYYMECVIQHPDFRAVCLTDAVLEILMHCLREVRGYGADLQWENRTYRLVAYRAYTFWVHHRLGRKNRRVIPSCVVWEIRRQFPSPDGTYKGYQDVEEAWEL